MIIDKQNKNHIEITKILSLSGLKPNQMNVIYKIKKVKIKCFYLVLLFLATNCILNAQANSTDTLKTLHQKNSVVEIQETVINLETKVSELEKLKETATHDIELAKIIISVCAMLIGIITLLGIIAAFFGVKGIKNIRKAKKDILNAKDRINKLEESLFRNIYKINEGIEYFREGKFEIAKVLFKEMLDANKYDYTAKCYLAKILIEEGKYHSAIKCAKDAMKLVKNPDHACLIIGEAKKRQHLYPDAIDYFKESFYYNPRNSTLNHIGYAYLNNNDVKNAKKTFTEALKYKESHTTLCGLIKCCLKNGDTNVVELCERAIKSAKKSISKNAKSWPYPHYNLAFSYMILENEEKCLKHLEKAIEKSADSSLIELQYLDYKVKLKTPVAEKIRKKCCEKMEEHLIENILVK